MAFNKSIILLLSLSSLLSLYVEARSIMFPTTAPDFSYISQVPSSSPDLIDPEVQRVCDGTDFPTVCINTIVPLTALSPKIDAITILEMGLKALTSETHQAIDEAKRLINSAGTTPEFQDCLNICLDSYESVLESNDKANSLLPTKDVLQLEGPIDGAVTLINDCDDAFTELSMNYAPLQKINEVLMELAKNNVGISNALLTTQPH